MFPFFMLQKLCQGKEDEDVPKDTLLSRTHHYPEIESYTGGKLDGWIDASTQTQQIRACENLNYLVPTVVKSFANGKSRVHIPHFTLIVALLDGI